MSIQSEIDRINSNVQTTLNTIAETGVEVGEGSNALPAAAAALANEKMNVIHVSTSDNGKFMRVVNGEWTAVALTDVSEVGA